MRFACIARDVTGIVEAERAATAAATAAAAAALKISGVDRSSNDRRNDATKPEQITSRPPDGAKATTGIGRFDRPAAIRSVQL
jgi:hypothetical protein